MGWLTELVGERLKPLVEIAASQDISGLARGIAFRLSESFGTLRREAAAEEIRVARPAGPRAAPQLRRALRRVQYLLSGAAEAGVRRAGADAVGPQGGRQARPRHRGAARATASGPHLCAGRQGGAGGLLPRRRLPRVRPPGGAHRHAGAARRSDTAADRVAARSLQPERAAQGRHRRRRLPADAGDDVHSGLLGRASSAMCCRRWASGWTACASLSPPLLRPSQRTRQLLLLLPPPQRPPP